MNKIFNAIFYVFIIFAMIMMLFVSYTSWKNQKLFSEGDKETTIATIKIDENKVKTYNYKENDYGVDASKSLRNSGDKVTVYFLKDKPDIVSENPYVYNSQMDILFPLIWFLIGLGIIFFKIYNNY
ncbi:hypothetical protein ACYSNW_08025 [Enterococcus sp. LJL99]